MGNLHLHMSYWLISWHITLVKLSMIFGMTIWATCKVYSNVQFYVNIYISNIYISYKWYIQYIIVYVQHTNVDYEIKYLMKKHTQSWTNIYKIS